MTDYSVQAGHNGTEPWTMTAGQVDTVTFAENVSRVEIVSDGAAEVRVTNGGTTPAIGADGQSTVTFRLPAGSMSVADIPLPKDVDVLKLVSSGTARVSVSIPR